MTAAKGRPRLDADHRRAPMELSLTPRERAMALSLSGGYQTSVTLRNLIVATYEDARRCARDNAAEFLRRSSPGFNRWGQAVMLRGECTQQEAWDTVREVVRTGDPGATRVTLHLQVGTWQAVLPAALESYIESPARVAPTLHNGHLPRDHATVDETPAGRTPGDAKRDPQLGDQRRFDRRQLSNGPVTWTVRARDGDLLEVDSHQPNAILPHYVARGVSLADWQGKTPGQKEPSTYHPGDGAYHGL